MITLLSCIWPVHILHISNPPPIESFTRLVLSRHNDGAATDPQVTWSVLENGLSSQHRLLLHPGTRHSSVSQRRVVRAR